MPGFEALTEFANWSTDTLAEYPYSGWLISYMRPRKSTTDVVDVPPAIATNVGSVPVGVSSAVANAGAPRLRALTRQVSKTSPPQLFSYVHNALYKREQDSGNRCKSKGCACLCNGSKIRYVFVDYR